MNLVFTTGSLAPRVQAGLHGRVHIQFGPNGPGVVGQVEEMRAMAHELLTACAAADATEAALAGELQSCNDDIHPREPKEAAR